MPKSADKRTFITKCVLIGAKAFYDPNRFTVSDKAGL